MPLILVFLSHIAIVFGNVYLHNPRGSNNRFDDPGRERLNANRLFDSQNNNRGGYNVGNLYYHVGSKLMIEWTNQHSCMNPNNHCEIILQYMCGSRVRDGTSSKTIPERSTQCENYDCNSDWRYGLHESYEYYQQCEKRERNKGLFTADQNMKGDRAKFTRQNPRGIRRGYECPEERDYYPYWHPTPWRDIAIMTNDPKKCEYYRQESENVKGRWYCDMPQETLTKHRTLKIPDNKADCEALRYLKIDRENGINGTWRQESSHGVDPPECMENQYSRDNHLGNGIGGHMLNYNWTIPDAPHDQCVFRIRYNVSTAEYEAWGDTDAKNNKQTNDGAANLDLSQKYGFGSQSEATERGYEFENNPEVQIFEGAPNMKLQLAVNTAQFGRTFQDRSHVFSILPTSEGLTDATIHNVNVRGKRGNIVQVYPAVEYDFVPNTLEVRQNQYVHFQWTGSNSNPNNNAGQGRAGTDRSNVVLIDSEADSSGLNSSSIIVNGDLGRNYPEKLSDAAFLGFNRESIRNLATLRNCQFGGKMSELDEAGTYYDLGPRKATQTGIYNYLSTRNNNFSNRSQKGKIIVTT